MLHETWQRQRPEWVAGLGLILATGPADQRSMPRGLLESGACVGARISKESLAEVCRLLLFRAAGMPPALSHRSGASTCQHRTDRSRRGTVVARLRRCVWPRRTTAELSVEFAEQPQAAGR